MKLVPRSEWGARAPKARDAMRTPAPRTWIHHTAAAFPRDPTWTERLFFKRACAYVREIQTYHQASKGWNDIAYSFLVLGAFFGRRWVFEGRGWGIVGAHTEGDNSSSHGIAVIGNCDVTKPRRGVVKAIRTLIDRGCQRGSIASPRRDHPTGGHRDAPGAATACPGRYLYSRLDDMRRPH